MFFTRTNVWKFLLGLGVVCVIFVFFVYAQVRHSNSLVFENISEVPTSSVALVFGAGIRANGRLSDALTDRVNTAVNLYKNGKVQKLLMSGDNSTVYYDEVTAMKRFAVEAGLLAEDIVLDYAGFDTYDSCYRARDIFEVRDRVILVSQRFHLPRALYICRSLGIESVGMVADQRVYATNLWGVREFLATLKAGFEVEILHSKPKFLGNKEPIF